MSNGMSDEEMATKRGWCIDYALRLQPKNKVVTPARIIKDATQFENYILGKTGAQILTLSKTDKK